MIRKIGTSSASFGIGLSTQRRIFVAPAGEYQGRTIVIFPKSSSEIVFVWADPPCVNWSAETTVVTDAADYPCDACIDKSGNVYLAYTVATSFDLAFKKLSFANGVWTVGSAVTIYNGGTSLYPSIYMDDWDRLIVSWTLESGGQYYIHSKRSLDDGATWGGGPGDSGDQLSSGASSAYSQIVHRPNQIYCIYSLGGTTLACRSREFAAAVWTPGEETVYSGTGLSDKFSAAASPDLRLGVVFTDSEYLNYKEFDGSIWSGVAVIDNAPPVAPRLIFRSEVPQVFYAKQIGNEQLVPCISYRENGVFVDPVPVSSEIDSFDKVLCYRPIAGQPYSDMSSEAAGDSPGDVYHPASGRLMLDEGDGVYIGQSEKFYNLKLTLSTIGAGGTVSWYYWNGAGWQVFIPASGAYNFDSSSEEVLLWEDGSQIPDDWQSSTVANSAKFWVKAVATSDFSTGPIGSQITCALNISRIGG